MKRALLSAALLLSLAHAARAQDSSVGVDMNFGSKLDGSGWSSLHGCSADGTSWLTPSNHRTPTGFFYGCAPAAADPRPLGDWLYTGTLNLGYVRPGGSALENTLWQRYSDWERGFLLGLSSITLERPEDGSYIDLRGDRISDDNQFYKLNAGQAGRFRVEAFYRELPNVITANARSIWDGIGTSNLTLKDSLVPGGSTPEQVAAVSAAAPVQRLQFTREREGLGLTYYFNPTWSALVNIANDDRKGARPYGGPFFFNYPFPANGGVLETPRPINDSTVSLNAALRGGFSSWRTEVTYSGSFYRSGYTGYDYQTPFSLYPVIPGAVSAPLTTGQFSLEPDNDYHYLRLTLGRKLPFDGDLALTASGSRMRQNDNLLAPVTCQGQFGIDLSPTGAPVNPYLFDCANWNTTDALSRKTADLTIDTSMLFARFVMQPWKTVTLRADAKYRNEDYRGDYIAFNPLTGQYGYVSENGSQGSVVPGEAGFWDSVLAPSAITRIRNIPLDKKTLETHVGADWRVSRYDTLGATYGFTRTDRDHRERYSTDDNELRLTWLNRRIEWLTLRANYTFLDQSGDDYDFDPYEFAYSTSLPGFVDDPAAALAHTVDAMRKYDVSSRRQHKVDVMATVMPADDMTLSFSARGDLNDYSAEIGRQSYDTFQTTVQWEWQPMPTTNASVYYGYERTRLKFANVNDAGATLADPTLGGLTYLDAARWWMTDKQRNHHIGATLQHTLGRVQLDAAWNFTYSRGIDGYRFASALALAWPDTVDSAGNAFPPMTYRVNAFNVGLRIPLRNGVAVRVFDYYERGNISDWHYAGFGQQLVYDHRVYTDGGPGNYSDNLVGVLVEIPL